ncbi:MAG: tRNA(Ile)-lysidine synthase [Gammaproteobacteria bacterium]|nr:tRNA(Ile)-lysidine synthase [Gammaproteobacteria bacterium]
MSFSAAYLRAMLETHTPRATTGLVVAVSGGTDSACLLTALRQLQPPFRNLPVRAVHVDHGLQPAAADFRRACEELCRRVGVPLTIVAVVVDPSGGVSIEAAARDARYAGIAGQLAAGECLLTAHHAEDQAETVLLQLLRGAGVKGLSAMPTCRAWCGGWHLRPLLAVTQQELRRYGERAGVPGVPPDPMNLDLRFDRVYLREQVWPLIESRWPGAAVALSRTACHVADAQALLDRSAVLALPKLADGDTLSVTGLRALTAAEQRNAVRYWIASRDVAPPSSARLNEALRQIMAADADHIPAVPWGLHALRRYRDRLFLTAAAPPCVGEPRMWAVAPGKDLDLGRALGALQWAPQIGGLDPDRLPSAVCVRQRRGGETLKAHRRARTQSVQHLCQAAGVVPWMRDALPLLYAGDALVAVGDLWQDARWCVAEGAPGLGCVWKDAPALV